MHLRALCISPKCCAAFWTPAPIETRKVVAATRAHAMRCSAAQGCFLQTDKTTNIAQNVKNNGDYFEQNAKNKKTHKRRENDSEKHCNVGPSEASGRPFHRRANDGGDQAQDDNADTKHPYQAHNRRGPVSREARLVRHKALAAGSPRPARSELAIPHHSSLWYRNLFPALVERCRNSRSRRPRNLLRRQSRTLAGDTDQLLAYRAAICLLRFLNRVVQLGFTSRATVMHSMLAADG